MAVDVSAVLAVITGMLPGVVAVGFAVLMVRASIEAFRYVRSVIALPAPAVDPYNNDRVNAIHEENGWDPEWDEPSPAAGFPLPPAVVQAYADNNGIPPRG